MDSPRRFWIKVLLFENIKECSLVSQSGFNTNIQSAAEALNSSDHRTEITVTVNDGMIMLNGKPFGYEVLLQPHEPSIFSINDTPYRGNVRFIVNRQTATFIAINELPVEAYLRGVVGAEMPSYWQAEALKAQAIAARTYCLYIKQRFGAKRSWDVKKTQSHQVYRGVNAETATVKNAVTETSGMVLSYRKNDGSEKIFPSYYSSSCGGHTEDSRNVYGGDAYPPLIGVPCNYCRDVARKSFFYWPKAVFDAAKVSAVLIKRYPKLKSLDSISTIEPIKRPNRRITSVKLIGKNGKNASLRGEDMRLTIDPTGTKIRSMLCEMIKGDGTYTFRNGKGFGHGVGMCQCGAQGMARKKNKYDQILAHYYPGSVIVKTY